MNHVDTGQALEVYATGKYTIKQVAEKFGISTGKMYYLLKNAGCQFIKSWRNPMPQETKEKISKAKKGWKMSAEQRKAISKRNSCDYNGLNGYGHTKRHNGGYIRAYVPKHPNAQKDGYVMLHTVIMEQSLGRYLNDNEVVHHINHNKADNRIENLMLMDKHEHLSMHLKERHEKKGE